MNVSIFDVSGPIMIGPSSSHTAGAARLARVARAITAQPFSKVTFGMHGSFAKTYKGHGTDRALVAGALGIHEDDDRLVGAFTLAREEGLTYEFYETDLDGMHENSVKITFYLLNGETSEIIGSSIGGAQIVIRRINGLDIEFCALLPTLLITHNDQRGVVSDVTRILAESGLNIGIMKLSRSSKGGIAFCVIETDDLISNQVVAKINAVAGIRSTSAIIVD